ncbi:MAG: glycosyltransferase family 39 protein [Deltaproteobacteria bacterium]|nr:glycosyltransferase family 39 protein [Deltaproteobacteria bacterium]
MVTTVWKWPTGRKLVWAILLVVASGAYFFGLSHEGIWYDEAYSMKMTEHSFLDIISFVMADNHPPLYYLLLKLMREILGTSEAALRVLSAAGAVLIVALGAGPVRRVVGEKCAVIYGVITLFTPAILIYAHEARMYTLAIAAVTASVLYGWLALRDHRIKDWVLFGVATSAAAYLHYYALIAAFFTHVFVLAVALTKQPANRKPAIVTGGLVLAGYLPWLLPFVRQTLDVKAGFWLGPPTVTNVIHAFYQPFAYKDMFQFPDSQISLTMHLALGLTLVLVVAGLVMAVLKRKREKNGTVLAFGAMLWFVYLGTLMTSIAVSLLIAPIFYARYFLVCLGIFTLMVSMAISQLPGKLTPHIAIGAFVVLNVFVMKNVYTQYYNHPMRQLAAEFEGKIKPGDLIATCDSLTLGPVLYYFPDAVHYHSQNDFEGRFDHVLNAIRPWYHEGDAWKQLFSKHQSFWYITSNLFAKSVNEIVHYEQGWQAEGKTHTIATPTQYLQYNITKYVYVKPTVLEERGSVTATVSGVRPKGNMFVSIYKDSFGDFRHPYQFRLITDISQRTLSHTFSGLEYGEYSVIFAHDENGNMNHDQDDTGDIIEGIWNPNPQNINLSTLTPQDFTFDKFKFTLDTKERTFEGHMFYPAKE